MDNGEMFPCAGVQKRTSNVRYHSLCLHHVAHMRLRCGNRSMWMHFQVLLLQQKKPLENFAR